MSDQPHLNPALVAFGRLLVSWAMRFGSVAFGVAIEVKQVYGADQAQWALVFLGLWFIGVPPALWFDGVWRLARIAAIVDQQAPGSPPAGPASGPAAPRHLQERPEGRP